MAVICAVQTIKELPKNGASARAPTTSISNPAMPVRKAVASGAASDIAEACAAGAAAALFFALCAKFCPLSEPIL